MYNAEFWAITADVVVKSLWWIIPLLTSIIGGAIYEARS